MTAWTSPRTWVANEVPGAATFNTHVRDNLNAIWERIGGAGWTDFTPSWTNLTPGSGTNVGRYAYAGKSVLFEVEFTYGTGSAVGSPVALTLPVTSVSYANTHSIAVVSLYDATAGIFIGDLIWATTTTSILYCHTVSGSNVIASAVAATVPFTWTTNDRICISGFYEAA